MLIFSVQNSTPITSGTVGPNHLKFAVQVVPTMDPCGSKFQVIRTNGSRVIVVGSWAEKIGNLQFPVRLTDSLLIYFIRSQLLYLTTDQKYYKSVYYVLPVQLYKRGNLGHEQNNIGKLFHFWGNLFYTMYQCRLPASEMYKDMASLLKESFVNP